MAKEDNIEKDEQATPEEQSAEQGVAEEQVANDEQGDDEAINKLKAEVGEFKDKYLRLYSEFDNFRKRTAKEKIEFLKSANKDLMLSLLPVVDDVERADKAFDKEKVTLEQVKEGYELIFQKLKTTLEKAGLKEMENTIGSQFDVEYHEAVTQFPAPSDDMKGKIMDELEKGYMLGDKVIRFPKVVVGA